MGTSGRENTRREAKETQRERTVGGGRSIGHRRGVSDWATTQQEKAKETGSGIDDKKLDGAYTRDKYEHTHIFRSWGLERYGSFTR